MNRSESADEIRPSGTGSENAPHAEPVVIRVEKHLGGEFEIGDAANADATQREDEANENEPQPHNCFRWNFHPSLVATIYLDLS